MDAPERIWIQSDHIPDSVALDKWDEKPDAAEAHFFTEYLRADCVEALEAQKAEWEDKYIYIMRQRTEVMRELDALVEENERLDAQVRAADALADALESSGNVTERHCRAMNALVAYRATKEGGAR